MFRTESLPGRLTATTGLFARLSAAVAAWIAVRSTLRVVEGLDEHLLRDIGLEPQPTDQMLRRRLMIL